MAAIKLEGRGILFYREQITTLARRKTDMDFREQLTFHH